MTKGTARFERFRYAASQLSLLILVESNTGRASVFSISFMVGHKKLRKCRESAAKERACGGLYQTVGYRMILA